MNVKRILLIGLILVAVVASLSIVSADNSVKVGGFDFNIPDGYIEDETVAGENVSNPHPSNDGPLPCIWSFQGFENGTDIIRIQVLEFNSPDDAKKAMDYTEHNLTAKTINGHEGVFSYNKGQYGFSYLKDKYFIMVFTTDESLLENVVPK